MQPRGRNEKISKFLPISSRNLFAPAKSVLKVNKRLKAKKKKSKQKRNSNYQLQLNTARETALK